MPFSGRKRMKVSVIDGGTDLIPVFQGAGADAPYGEDYLAGGTVILSFFSKDVTEILLSWINACFVSRLNDLNAKKEASEETAMDVSHMNMVRLQPPDMSDSHPAHDPSLPPSLPLSRQQISSRIQRKSTFFEKLEEENANSILSEAVLPAADYKGAGIFSTKKIAVQRSQVKQRTPHQNGRV